MEVEKNKKADPEKEAKKEVKSEKKIHKLDKKNPDFETLRGHTATITTKKGDHTFKFEMPFGTPLNDCYLAAVEVLKEIKFWYEDAVKVEENRLKEEADKKKAAEGESSTE